VPKISSQIVELNNAYAFAREKGLLLPSGLVALRPANSSPDSQKIGSYKTTTKAAIGTTTGSPNNTTLEPLLLIVLSVSNGDAAEIIFSTRDWGQGGHDGKIWRYTTATLSGPRLEFRYKLMTGTTQENPYEFKWRDADSGILTAKPEAIGFHSSPFTRLD
jgi:hypothetical protein